MNPQSKRWLDEEEDGFCLVELPQHLTNSSFVTGDPDGERLRVRYFIHEQDRRIMSKVWFGPGTQGPPGHAHGGSIAAVLDESMGGAAWFSGHMGIAAQISISFLEMVPLETCCTIQPEVVEIDGRKVHVESVLRDRQGREYARGRGLFIALQEGKFGDVAASIEGVLHMHPVGEHGNG